eukprot:4028886-Pleurochrysis_carterae.AAC.1
MEHGAHAPCELGAQERSWRQRARRAALMCTPQQMRACTRGRARMRVLEFVRVRARERSTHARIRRCAYTCARAKACARVRVRVHSLGVLVGPPPTEP